MPHANIFYIIWFSPLVCGNILSNLKICILCNTFQFSHKNIHLRILIQIIISRLITIGKYMTSNIITTKIQMLLCFQNGGHVGQALSVTLFIDIAMRDTCLSRMIDGFTKWLYMYSVSKTSKTNELM